MDGARPIKTKSTVLSWGQLLKSKKNGFVGLNAALHLL
jgi:hypothetical protein